MSLGSRQYVDQNGIVYLEAGAGDVVGTSSPLVGATLPAQVRASGLTLVGVITMLLGIWGGIIPFMGPTFAYSADGSSAWNMNNAHLVLAVLPGAAAFATGLAILMVAPRIVAGVGRNVLSLAGLLGLLAGAWFAVGPVAWPVLSASMHYFVPASPLRELGFQVGYALGPGLLVAISGGFTLGWAARHQGAGAKWVGTPERSASPAPAEPVLAERAVPGVVAATPVARQSLVTNRPVVSNQPVVAE